MSRRSRRRPVETVNIAFLDVLCSGFGAVVILFILSIGSGNAGVESPVDAVTLAAMRTQLAALEADIADKAARLETAAEDSRTRELRRRLLSLIQERESQLADLQQEYDTLAARLSASQQSAAEAARLLRSFKYQDLPPIGLPAESTHVAFVIDTSGSMRNRMSNTLHNAVLDQINKILSTLPQVTSMQFLDSSGNYMLGAQSGYWLPDQPGLRRQALQTVRGYPVYSVSDPERGIRRAIGDLLPRLDDDERMGIYVLGDDFRGSTQSLLVKLDRLNPYDPATQERPVSISAIGFPTMVNPLQIATPQGNVRFANVMREIAEAHNGVLILKPRL